MNFFYQGTNDAAHFQELNFHDIWKFEIVLNRKFSEIWLYFSSQFALYYINFVE